jgi:hypothetical protein
MLSSASPSLFVEQHIHANELNDLMRAHPHTECKQTKKDRDGTKKYKYCKCSCGCSYRNTLTHEDEDMIVFKEQ